ncbi:protein-export membrane protein SecF [candidate division Kazan bacterium RBG_13_50_9]|uniref:Protein-export membrane protein SecF n=1 Tax=candidate division Kazan bacterium RBG_13_50_9 TaxID=1798535 RepID=A0A1F4NSA5_UNCK3|nr:MAG: protein-export membrane protein SecF [candidate division Kazan bacterium RBG_13_50_9]
MNILGTRKIWFAMSAIVIIVGLLAIGVYGYRTGIDFVGGTILEVQLSGPIAGEGQPRTALVEGYKSVTGLDVAAQTVDEGRYFVRSNQIDNGQKNAILAYLGERFSNVTELRFESVDPTIGADVVRKAVLAVIVAVVGILLYVAYSFRRVPKPISSWRFGIAAILALVHDVLVLLGLYAIVGKFFGAEVDGLFITALLTLLGFSVHDTIVTFDRIRENLRRRAGDNLEVVINDSVVETIIRSINTSFTLFLVLVAMFFFGGATLKFFTLALLIGVVVGTYSSIFVASPILLWGGKPKA